VLDEIEALRSELAGIEDGQVVIIFYDEFGPVLGLLEEHGAAPVGAVSDAGRKPKAMKV